MKCNDTEATAALGALETMVRDWKVFCNLCPPIELVVDTPTFDRLVSDILCRHGGQIRPYDNFTYWSYSGPIKICKTIKE